MNKFINSLEKSLPFVFGLCVFLYFGLVYPHHVHYQEQFQLFLTTPAFFLEMAAKPGGISNYLGTFLTQFFLFSWMGAAIIALLLAAMQWLIQTIANKISPARAWLALSFIPSVFYWILLCNENFLTGGVVSILVALGAWLLYFHINKTTTRNLYVVLAIPVIYWIAEDQLYFSRWVA